MNVSRSMDNSAMSMANQSLSVKEHLDLSGKMLDRFFIADDSFPTLVDKMQINKNGQYFVQLKTVCNYYQLFIVYYTHF